MKKNVLLLLCLFAILFSAKAQSIDQLLDRLNSEDIILKAEPEGLYTSEEKEVLHNHFNNILPSAPINLRAVGDVYITQIYSGCEPTGFGKMPLEGPYDINIINSSASQVYAGDFDTEGNLYALASKSEIVGGTIVENFRLIKIDKLTGTETIISQLEFPDKQYGTGLAWNYKNSTLYILTSDLYTTKLYTFDISTGVLNEIGETGNPKGIWLAIDNDGKGYVADIGTTKLYEIDLETAKGTVIGNLGINIKMAQDADFNPETNKLYTAAYFGGGGNGFYEVNTETGEYSYLGVVNNSCAQLGMVAIDGEYNVGISDNNTYNTLSIYPNPTKDIINISSDNNIQSIVIYNILGQQVSNNYSNIGTQFKLDVSNYNNGVYMLKAIINGKTEVYKFIKN